MTQISHQGERFGGDPLTSNWMARGIRGYKGCMNVPLMVVMQGGLILGTFTCLVFGTSSNGWVTQLDPCS